MEIYEQVLKMQKERREAVLVTVVGKEGQGPSVVGKKLLVASDGSVIGTVGGGELEYLALKKAKEIIASKFSGLQSYNLNNDLRPDQARELNMLCGGSVTLFFEYLPVSPQLYIFGAGHIGMSIIYYLKNLDYKVALIETGKNMEAPFAENSIYEEDQFDDSFVVIAGYSHEVDYHVLKSVYLTGKKPKYIGVVASVPKARAMINKLTEEVKGSIDLGLIHAPAGLGIGGASPEEIALSIVAEIQSVRYNKNHTGPLSEKWFI